jgi:hypothetical protein
VGMKRPQAHAFGRSGRTVTPAMCTLFLCKYRIQAMIPLRWGSESVSIFCNMSVCAIFVYDA